MKYKIADFRDELVSNNFDVFVHGVNAKGVMGAGIAKIVREVYPSTYDIYREGLNRGIRQGDNIIDYRDGDRIIIHAVTQFLPGSHATYWAIEECFERISSLPTTLQICFPLIGCGIGGLEWGKVSTIIADNLVHHDYTCIVRQQDVDNYNLKINYE